MSGPLHIGLFAFYLSGAGPRVRSRTLCRALAADTPHQVTVVTHRGSDVTLPGARVAPLLSKPRLADPRTLWRVRRALADCDVVHVPVNRNQLLYTRLAYDGPLVAGPGLQHTRPWLYRLARPAHVIDTSEYISFWDAAGIAWTAIYPFVDTERFYPYPDAERKRLRAAEGYATDTTVALFVGNCTAFKGADLMAELATITDDSTAVIVCGDGPLARRLDAHDGVDYRGYIANETLPHYYNLADVTVVPSRTESFSLVALESAACGTPVITTTAGEHGRRTNRMGKLFKPRGTYRWVDRTAPAIEAGLRELCADEAAYRDQVAAGFRTIREMGLTLDAALDTHVDIYREVAE